MSDRSSKALSLIIAKHALGARKAFASRIVVALAVRGATEIRWDVCRNGTLLSFRAPNGAAYTHSIFDGDPRSPDQIAADALI